MPAWDRCLDPPEAKIEADTPAVGPTKVGDLGEASDGQDVGRMSRRAILADLRCILDEEQLHDHQPENRHQTDQGQGSTVSEIALHEGKSTWFQPCAEEQESEHAEGHHPDDAPRDREEGIPALVTDHVST